jgi:hypothetical protein
MKNADVRDDKGPVFAQGQQQKNRLRESGAGMMVEIGCWIIVV